MKEVRTGLRHILALPWIYDTFQTLVGAYSWRDTAIKTFVSSEIPEHGKLIDIGCGTAEAVKFLPESVEYIGFDRNPAYIEKAKERYGHLNATFFCEELSLDFTMDPASADVVLALGLIHHLDDNEVLDLLSLAKKLLKPGGFLLTLDPLYEHQQSYLARYIISKDRGTAVRTELAYKQLVMKVCSKVDIFVDRSPLRIPYTGIVMKCYFS
ncbi:MAG: hypothetical protein CTY34_02165 [Methylobacter sp.]|nr:MAG: hypothetical protein CTY34_02165 [Methylobacter sp.]PPD05150.1 MAG: hypothetical protein CTY29_02495 [Methylobacter sp.]PPD24353.1 MAG: hypothetical protein CTY24_01205 [Methylobacter sp.]